MLHLQSLSKHYGSKTLFENAEAHLPVGSKVALIGANGAGKSTLIKLILGQESIDHGEIILRKGARVGHLAQEVPKFENLTVFEEVLKLDGRREEVIKRKKELETLLTQSLDEKKTNDILKEYTEVLDIFDTFDEYRLPSRAEQVLEGIGFAPKDFHRRLSELSGGWLMRVALARILLIQPELLILDEPTNHLDLESLLWLEEFLKEYKGSILLVSHDRAFLNRLVDQVWEIDQKKIVTYAGNLDSFVTQKEERLKILEAQFAGQQQKVAEIRAFVARFGAKATKARQAQSRLKQLDKMELIDLPENRERVAFSFPPCPSSGKEVVTIKNAGVNFKDKTVFSKFDWILQRGSRVAIVGVNGAGKTTLLRTLAQNIALTEGSIKLGHNVAVGYYSQIQAESLNQENTIFHELETAAPKLTITQVRGVAGAFLFSGDDVHKKIKVLSGGEKARVSLAKLLLTPNNFLIIDEPTNHLDAESREVLLEALMNYEGTLCLVSHDREFVAPLVDQLLEIQDQKIIPLVITYDEYLAKKVQETRDRLKRPLAREKDKKMETSAMLSSEKPSPDKPSNNQLRAWKTEFEKTEKEISKLEMRQYELSQILSTEDFSSDAERLKKLIDEQSQNQQQLDQKLSRWEELGTKI